MSNMFVHIDEDTVVNVNSIVSAYRNTSVTGTDPDRIRIITTDGDIFNAYDDPYMKQIEAQLFGEDNQK